MKNRFIFLVCFLITIFYSAFSQVSDDFSDGNITDNPEWIGEITNFTVNANNQLQLAAPAASGQSFLATESEIITQATWSFFVKLDFNPSSSNYADIYLVSDKENLTEPLNGYFVRIGNTKDEVCLYKQSGEKSSSELIIDGLDDRVDVSPVQLHIKVTKSLENQWDLYVDTAVNGNYISEGSIIDGTHFYSRFFGMLCTFTSTRSSKFFFDDILITGESFNDDEPPVIDSLLMLSDSSIQLIFSEKLAASTIGHIENYFVDKGIGNPYSALLENDSAICLLFKTKFYDNVNLNLTVGKVEDLFSNSMEETNISFTYQAPYMIEFGDVIVTEIMADPTPEVDLPEYEYLEIFNPSDTIFDVAGMKLIVGEDTATIPDFTFYPDTYIILCPKAAEDEFANFGKTIVVSNWPSLNNRGEPIALYNSLGKLIFFIEYENTWYNSIEKDDGGWSIEMIDTEFPLKDAVNWTASIALSGGTPGQENASKGHLTDFTGPEIQHIIVRSDSSLSISFNEPLMVSPALNPDNYNVNNGIGNPAKVIVADDSTVILSFAGKFEDQLANAILIHGIEDKYSNPLKECTTEFTYFTPYVIGFGDVIITEIMADPTPEVNLPEFEYLEIFNPSDTIFDVIGMKLIVGEDTATLPDFTFYPDTYIILCPKAAEDEFANFGKTIVVSNWPSLNNRGESIALYNSLWKLIFFIEYENTWYNSIEKDDGGWSIEMIDTEFPLKGAVNWTASIALSGGTPGQENASKGHLTDFTGPEIQHIIVRSDSSLSIRFNEPLMVSSALNPDNYNVNNGIGNPAKVIDADDSTVIISFAGKFEDQLANSITIHGIEDIYSNPLKEYSAEFTYFTPYVIGFGDVIITEIMADPTPEVDLPEYEYLEIFNPSDDIFSLNNVRLVVGNDTTSLPHLTLNPNEYVILCQHSAVEQLEKYGRTIKVPNWPSLNNSAETISLLNQNDELVCSIAYTDLWYKSMEKDDGGWSLEIIDTNFPCKGYQNWVASNDPSGGTPGRKNGSEDQLTDLSAFEIAKIIADTDTSLIVFLNENIGPQEIILENISINPMLDIKEATLPAPDFSKIILSFGTSILPKIRYELAIKNLSDCPGNIQKGTSSSFVLPEKSDSLDLIINEILFNPWPDGVDFVELYNQSEKYIDLKSLVIGNIDFKPISTDHMIIEPKQFIALTENPEVLNNHYPGIDPKNIMKIDDLPSFNDDDGKVILMNTYGELIDFFQYSNSYHSDFLQDPEGVSLERISFEGPSDNPNNWQSAASTSGYATPGKMNSQVSEGMTQNAEVIIDPKVFSPGNNGFRDFTTIKCKLPNTGNMASIKILDATGRIIKTIISHESIGSEDVFKWEGLDDNGQEVREGYYIVYLEIYNFSGVKKLIRKKVVVGGMM